MLTVHVNCEIHPHLLVVEGNHIQNVRVTNKDLRRSNIDDVM
jgi:hypothetical protein